jgi:ribosomal protein L7/L12
MSMTVDPQTLKRCPTDVDEAIVFLHAEGLSIIDSIRLLSDRDGLGLGEAKRLVSASPVWAEVVEATNRAIDQYLDEFEAS